MNIIQEIQTDNGVTALVPAVVEADRDEAESKFLLACSYAVKSTVDVHTVIWYDEHGNVIDRKFYEHLSTE